MRVKVYKQDVVIETEPLYSHSNGIVEAIFDFDDSWDGWTKYAVFQLANGKAVSVALDDDACEVPSEMFRTAGSLIVGVYGVKDGKTMPTEWGEQIPILVGTPIVVAEDAE